MAKKMKLLSSYAAAYTMWAVSFGLWVLFMFTSRNTILGYMQRYYVNPNFIQRGHVIETFDRFYLYFMGLAWLVVMLLVEHYFNRGVKKGDLLRRIGRVIGSELLLLFAALLGRDLLVGLNVVPLNEWLILILILVGTVVFLWLGSRPKSKTGLLHSQEENAF